MVHGLIRFYDLSIGAMNLRAPSENFGLSKDESITTESWNPLLIAIGAKKRDVV